MTGLRDSFAHPAAPEPARAAATPAPTVVELGTPSATRLDPTRTLAVPDRWTRVRAWVRAGDDRVDAWFEPFRGRAGLDGAAKVITGLADQGFVWAAITAWRARRPGPERSRAMRALAVAGLESSLSNLAIKRSVGRSRPDRTGLRVGSGGIPVREPTSSSFPSGHTLAAFSAATVMARRGDRSGNLLLFAGATLVGLSRLHLRAHHASDVLGGALVGTALGLAGRRLL